MVMHLEDSRVWQVSTLIISRVFAVKSVAVLQLKVFGGPELAAILELVPAAHNQEFVVGVHALVLGQGLAEVEVAGRLREPVEVWVDPTLAVLRTSCIGRCHLLIYLER